MLYEYTLNQKLHIYIIQQFTMLVGSQSTGKTYYNNQELVKNSCCRVQVSVISNTYQNMCHIDLLHSNKVISFTSSVIIWNNDMSCNTITVTYFILSVDISLSNFNYQFYCVSMSIFCCIVSRCISILRT